VQRYFLLVPLTLVPLILSCKSRSFSAENETSNLSSAVTRADWNTEGLTASKKTMSVDGATVTPHMVYAYGAVGLEGAEKIPYILFRLFPELGNSPFKGQQNPYEAYGFFTDTRPENANRPLPMGFTATAPKEWSTEISYMTRTCASCHTSRFKVGNETHYIDLGSNREMKLHQFNAAVKGFIDTWPQKENTAAFDSFLKKIQELIAAKPDGWFFSEQQIHNSKGETLGVTKDLEKEQRQLLLANNSQKLREAIIEIQRVNKGRNAAGQLLQQIYNASSTRKGKPAKPAGAGDGPAGIADSSGSAIATALTVLKFTPGAAPAGFDPLKHAFPGSTKNRIPSVWNQKYRPLSQWDGNIRVLIYRNFSAAMGVAGSPEKLNIPVNEIISEHIDQFPSPKYPFAIDAAKAERGKELYTTNCLGCHGPHRTEGDPKAFFANKDDVMLAELGTSQNRARVLEDPLTFKIMRGALLKACAGKETLTIQIDATKKTPCANNAEEVLHWRSTKSDAGIQKKEPIGYAFKPLDGIWARAPYLHNGSVPTLYHLLASDNNKDLRPNRFATGLLSYDSEKIGFGWELAGTGITTLRSTHPAAEEYDTAVDGQSNLGHFGAVKYEGKTLRLSWDIKTEKAELEALLEYLKTF
jgi:mono/diheme cytochrome c family protein